VILEDESNVILDWKKGSKRAYESLVRHYMTDAYMVAYGFVGNREDARDLSQDAFIKAYQARERFDEDRPFYPWLYRIIKNHCLNFLKRAGRFSSSLYYEDNPAQERYSSDDASPLEDLELNERKRMLRAAVDMLSEDHREIIMLKNFKGLAYQEISEVLEIPMGTVMSRLYYARNSLKEVIERLEREGVPAQQRIIPGDDPATGEV